MENIIIQIEECKRHLSNIKDFDNPVEWFKKLCTSIADLILILTSYTKAEENPILTPKLIRSCIKSLLLYLTQITTLLSLLIQIFLKEDVIKEVILGGRNFITKQLKHCIDGIKDCLENNENANENNSFQKLIDTSLNKLAEIDVNDDNEVCSFKYRAAYSHVEEVLCHAMSIAQVTIEEDSKVIRGSCKSVLNDLDSLLIEINKQELNAPMCNLSIDSCYDKLCSLEKKVNTAVLRLSLKVFSCYIDPLDKLNQCCFDKIEDKNLDDIIADFDMHVDRIMQIGFFAITSTSNISSTVKMKNCLASLEALECELVPSLNTVFINNTEQNKNFACLLVKHWKRQAENLKNSIYLIIDPFALCQVAYEEIKIHVENIKKDNQSENALLSKMDFLNNVIEECRVTVDIVSTSIQDIDLDNIEKVRDICQDIRNMIYELKSAINLCLIQNKPTKIGNERISKRCKIIKGLLKKLLLSLAEDDGTKIGAKNIEDIPKCDENNDALSDNDINKSLDYITIKGKEILKERSVLYKSPNKSVKNDSSAKNKDFAKPIPLSKFVHLRNLHFSITSKVNNDSSIDLQITAILADLENLSSSIIIKP